MGGLKQSDERRNEPRVAKIVNGFQRKTVAKKMERRVGRGTVRPSLWPLMKTEPGGAETGEEATTISAGLGE